MAVPRLRGASHIAITVAFFGELIDHTSTLSSLQCAPRSDIDPCVDQVGAKDTGQKGEDLETEKVFEVINSEELQQKTKQTLGKGAD
tara:strand:+ start:7 stop:267 length:261 start_codon:yes stop_codon:yes gene_type:complete